ncbi:TPA: glycoside hydrolase family 5 protein [Clostridioides difficile]|nr:endoglucanase [Clostridioides difficile]EQE84060.1 endoglucanase [Clostridioides difficile CD69]AXU32354.1 endoglucanase [Clostridioides difficile]AXU36142.1 endoglucanase [Clostridioides difficile]NJI64832.1 glycoside hydrolase family 5 protein [Clostridioides difficile]
MFGGIKIKRIGVIIMFFLSIAFIGFYLVIRGNSDTVKMQRGINIGNALESPKDFPWDVKMSNKFFDDIKDAGFDTVRIPVRFSDYTSDSDNFKIDEEFFKKIDKYVDYALDKDLIVVLDLHHFEEIMKEPRVHKEEFLKIWQQIANRYQKYDKKLVFELLNEPKENLSSQLLNEYIEEAIKIIRKTNPKRTIVVGPYNFYQIDYLNELNIPKDSNIVVSFHYYEPNDFAFQGNIYHKGFEHLSNITWEGTNEQMEYLKKRFDTVENWANKNKVKIFLGEFGITKEAPEASRRAWIKAVREEAEKRNFSWAYWELASGFGIYNQIEGTWDRDILSALIEKR